MRAERSGHGAFTAMGAPAGDAASRLGVPVQIAVILAVGLVYALFGLTSLGYDDEFINIAVYYSVLEPSWSAYLEAAHRDPVHPPGAYLVNFVLYAWLGDWSLVRAASAGFVGSCLGAYVVRRVAFDRLALFAALAVVVLSPTLLMWTTGLRWHGPFTAVLLLLLLLAADRTAHPWAHWSRLGALAVLLCYLGYLGLLLAPLVGLYALFERRRTLWAERLPIVVVTLGVCLAYSWELVGFVAENQALDRLGGDSAQTGSLLGSVVGMAQGILVNTGIFPLSVLGVATAATTALTLAVLLMAHGRRLAGEPLVWFLVAAIAILVATGMGAKYRNVTPVLPILLGLVVTLALQAPRYRSAALLGVVLLAATNLAGLHNLVRREDTAKGSWNTPVDATMAALAARADDCQTTYVLTWLGELAFHAAARGHPVLGYKIDRAAVPSVEIPAGACVAALITARGSLAQGTHAALLADLPDTPIERLAIGRDRHVAAKRWFAPELPDYYVELLHYGPLPAARPFPAWDAVELPPMNRSLPRRHEGTRRGDLSDLAARPR
ncbi:MAG: hypothetical protein ACOC3D_08095 [Pseudomonadota bacterium]